MTVNYHPNFFRAIFHWKGSVWKAIWKELLVWLVCYYLIKIILTFALPISSKDNTKALIKLFDGYTQRLPLEFLLGFYVAMIVGRWWSQVMAIPEPHENMATIAAYLNGTDEDSQHLRHTLARYLVMSFCIGYKKCSSKIKDLFPTNESFVNIGLMTKEECDIIDKVPEYAQYETPIQWVLEMFRTKHGKVERPILYGLTNYRNGIVALAKHNCFHVPLVYTQTVTVAVYGYFAFCLIGHQFFDPEPKIDTIFPFLTVLRFIFGVGWLKVAQDLAKPFGVDDDDIDMCAILSCHCASAFSIANFMPANRPYKSFSSNVGQYEKLKAVFDADITDVYHAEGQGICDKLNNILCCKNNRRA